jgi:excisionase family DNA binding protein
MSTDEDASLLNVPQVAAKLNVSSATVWRLVHRGELPSLRIGSQRGAPVRVDPDTLEAWLHSRKQPAGAADFPRSPHGGVEEEA